MRLVIRMIVKRSSVLQMMSTAFLILFFGIAAFSLVAAESESYERLQDMQEETLNLRIASNYLMMRMREFNTAGGISVKQTDFGPMLVLHELIGDYEYETRIFLHDNKLTEIFTFAGTPEDDLYDALYITDLDTFNISISITNLVNIDISYQSGSRNILLAALVGGEWFEQ
jgi:hypothetical protein